MAKGYVVEPDVGFVRDLQELGGDTLKKCYQCATCSVVCPISPDDKPFPRKEMIWAQWGLKDKLIGNPDIWLCHNCNDCSAYCPRGAKPGEVLAAARNYSFQYYAWPKFLGKALANKKSLPWLFAIPAAIFLFLIFMAYGKTSAEPGKIVFSKFLPVLYVDAVFIPTALFAIVAFVIGLKKFLTEMNGGTMPPVGGILKSLKNVLPVILKHDKFKECTENKDRYYGHLGILYGFLGLFVVTNLVFVMMDIFHMEDPFSLLNPVKILANLSALALIGGLAVVLYNRWKTRETSGLGTYYDWLFLLVLLGVALTGIFSELMRLAGIGALAYLCYYLHLICIFFLFAYAPFSKFAHLAYRTTAMAYADYVGRELPVEEGESEGSSSEEEGSKE